MTKYNESKNKNNKYACELFTDRKEPKQIFWDKYNKFEENIDKGHKNDLSIITYYGIGGIGKTQILKKLIDEIEGKSDKEFFYAIHDLSLSSDKNSVLNSIQEQLSEKYNFEFKNYAIAKSIYMKKVGEKEKEKEGKNPSDNKILGVIADVISLIPVVDPIIKIFNGYHTIVDEISRKNFIKTCESHEFQKEDPHTIFEKMQYYFAEDLAENLEKINKPLVLFIDTYEILVNELEGKGQTLSYDRWIKDKTDGLLKCRNILWVISGREKLKWGENDEELNSSLDQHLIGSLSKQDVIIYLDKAGIKEQNLQEGIYLATNGLPLYLDLCRVNYNTLKELNCNFNCNT